MNKYDDSNRMVTHQVNMFGGKKGLIAAILQNLGHEVPSNEELDRAVVEAARKIKSEIADSVTSQTG